MPQLVRINVPAQADAACIAADDFPEPLTRERASARRRKEHVGAWFSRARRTCRARIGTRVQVRLHVVERDASEWHQSSLATLAERGNDPALQIHVARGESHEFADA